MPGYGLTSKPTGAHHYGVEALADNIKALVTALGRDNCILVGHDWGAAVSWIVATKYPDLVTKLVIMNVPHPGIFTSS